MGEKDQSQNQKKVNFKLCHTLSL